MKKFLALLLALAMVFCLAACSGGDDTGDANSDNNTTGNEDNGNGDENTGSATGTSSINVSIASEPDTIDPALNSTVDGATMVSHLFAGLAKWAQDENGNLEIVADCATELPEGVVNDDGTVTYTYTLKDGLTWSDGEPLTAQDFVFAWNRAASTELAADYGYMFEVVDGYADIWATDDAGNYVNPDATLNAVAVDDTTIEVTLANAVAYWNELLAFPTYFPVREDVVADESWATDPSTYVSNGAYELTGWEHNSVITLTKNENYHDADAVTMNEINFYLSDDANNMLTNFENGDWLLIDTVPTNEIETLQTEYPDEFFIEGQIGTYYISWNINVNLLPSDSTLTGVEAEEANDDIRNALSLLLDRNYICEEIGQAGQQPASSFVAMGMTDADGSQFYENAGHSDDYIGYFDVSADAYESNYDQAIAALQQYYDYDESTGTFTNVPTITYLYNTDESNQAIAEYVQSAWSAVGINVQLENQEWNTFLNTRKNGDYTVARNGWLADYNDPISFLDMWTTASGNNDTQFGKGDHASIAMYDLDLTPYGYEVNVTDGTWAETYDVLISTIKSCTDDEARYAMMHLAEDMLMTSGCITPIYFYTDIYMLDSSVHGFFANPLGYKYFMYCTIEG